MTDRLKTMQTRYIYMPFLTRTPTTRGNVRGLDRIFYAHYVNIVIYRLGYNPPFLQNDCRNKSVIYIKMQKI